MEEREQLYQRFRAEAGKKRIDTYFDEDDLIDIYDYANDNNDDFVKMEVLFYGARVFPDSEALAIRRNYLYYYLGNDVATKSMLDHRDHRSTLSRLLEMRQLVDRGESIVDPLNDLLARVGELDDEEVIQLLNESQTAEHYQWVKRNLERIKSKCTYLPTLFYELVSIAQDQSDMPYALEMAEELTMLEPFNIDFWELLAELQYLSKDYEQCLATVEYALAINPKSVKSLTLKGLSLFSRDPKSDEALQLLLSMRDSDDFDVNGMQAIVQLLVNQEADAKEVIAVLRDFMKRLPGNPGPIDCLMALDADHLEDYAQALHSPSFPDDENYWALWADRHLREKRPASASMVLLESFTRNHNAKHYDMFLEALYRTELFEEVDAYFTKAMGLDDVVVGPECFIITIMAQLRLGKREEARNLLAYTAPLATTLLEPEADECDFTVTFRNIHTAGVREIYATLERALDAPDPAVILNPLIPID